jgi:hypothetical protein
VEADGANGNTLDWNCAFDNLLVSLQELARVAGGDFDLVKTAAATWEFRWYTGQLGTDRSATVEISLDRGNMGVPVKSWNKRIREKTVAIVMGQGVEDDRDYEIRTGTNYNVSTNNREIYVNASDVPQGNSGELQDRGDEKLDALEARDLLDFTVVQTASSRYKVHYALGDLVTVVNPYDGSSGTHKISDVTISLGRDGQETIHIDTETQ